MIDALHPLRRIVSEATLYACNHVIAHIPSHTVRLWFYRSVMGYKIAEKSYIFLGAHFDCKKGFSLGHNSVVNHNCRLDSRGGLEIENYVSISSDVSILTADHDPASSEFEGRLAPVRIEEYAFIGTRAIILRGVTIGKGAMVGAGSVVVKNVLPYTVVAGCPARAIGTRSQDLTYTGTYDRLFH